MTVTRRARPRVVGRDFNSWESRAENAPVMLDTAALAALGLPVQPGVQGRAFVDEETAGGATLVIVVYPIPVEAVAKVKGHLQWVADTVTRLGPWLLPMLGR